ncbi:hypothetical protein I302_108557 [Kwoniella bestiolae CBS 10118]|uniref:CENP-V/GFA domain-containing protein n=1 Tax=Kwoniella bestiolae CBS 10118 TaxID=1296100 RepID=A0A1B9FVD0_9TREE|nr:hypothetical protein I302_07070 [Kwoniella bestiolae CBS 10118]OCF22730.1 hypothetical protein I302_07070 [Kwoniella bestiolae CBS 10118]
MTQLTASCHCKHFSYDIKIPQDVSFPLGETTCSCDACRHRTGQICILTLSAKLTRSIPSPADLQNLSRYDQRCGFAIDQETIPAEEGESGDGDEKGGLNKYSSNTTCGGTIITSFFCGICGSKIYLQVASLTGKVEIGMWMLGCLDRLFVEIGGQEVPIVDMKGHHFLDDTVDGGISNIWKTSNGKQLKKYHDGLIEWVPHQNIPKEIKEDEMLNLHCKCKAFDVYVRRPRPSLPLPEGCYWYQQPNNEDGVPQRYMASWCACDSCRLITGSSLPSHPWVQIPFVDIFTSPSPSSPPFIKGIMTSSTQIPGLNLYHSSPSNPGISRYHCSTCGASIMYFDDKEDFKASFAVGLNDSKYGVMNTNWFSWWTGDDGVDWPIINERANGERRWGKGTLDDFEDGLIGWGKSIGQRK